MRSKGEHLRAELDEIEAQARADLEYGRDHGILRNRNAPALGAGIAGSDDNEREERVRSLAAAALAVVEQAMQNPELFGDIFDQAPAMIAKLRVENSSGAPAPLEVENGPGAAHGNSGKGVNGGGLENDIQDAALDGQTQQLGDGSGGSDDWSTSSEDVSSYSSERSVATASSVSGTQILSDNVFAGNLDSLYREEVIGDEFLDVASKVSVDYNGEDDDEIGLDADFLKVATQVPTDYTNEQTTGTVGKSLVDMDNINALLSTINTCIRWIAWIRAMMVVRSGRPGDDDDEDPPCNGPILLGWHGEEQVETGGSAREEALLRRQQQSRPRALDVQRNCRPGPSFRRDNEALIKSDIGCRWWGRSSSNQADNTRFRDITDYIPASSYKLPEKMRKWVNHYKLILAVASGQDIKDELIPAADLSSSVMRCIQRALQQKDDAMYCGWLDRFRGIFDPKFVEEVCRDDGETD
ncbi:uncharacterized protein [Triticum aestivum]|uniref:uncharacterized protein n=1 Tax=Triticum aestivum TaxID=4565 RepID=UPI001D021A55|nr:uncharacterized protein LOC123191839 [Triticum aestivum]